MKVFGREGGIYEGSSAVIALKEMIGISVDKHGSKGIGIVGHRDCAGNPVSEEEQIVQLERGIRYLSKEYEGLRIVGVWIGEDMLVRDVAG